MGVPTKESIVDFFNRKKNPPAEFLNTFGK